jgi:hypothetical protein
VHRRFVFSLHSEFWLVRDLVQGFGKHQIDLLWHLAPDLRPHHADPDSFLAENSGLQFMTAESHGWTRTMEEQPYSPAYGQQRNHNVLRFATRAQLPAEFVTLLQPIDNPAPCQRRLITIPQSAASPVVGYRYQSAGAEHCMFFGEGLPWQLAGWSSDAEFLYWSGSASRPLLICCKATYVEWEGRKIVSATRPVLRCEVIGAEEPEVISTNAESLTVDHAVWRALPGIATPVAVKIT